MRLLYVVHGLPPNQQAGTEIYTEELARAMAKSPEVGAVEVFTRLEDPARPEYELATEERDGFRVTRVNHLWRNLKKLEDLYRNPAIDALFAERLDAVAPDVVHVQHLIGLSADVIAVAAARGIPVVITLADFWFLCPRGQRIDARGRRQEEIDLTRCTRCMLRKEAAYLGNQMREWLREGFRRWPGIAASSLAYARENLFRAPLERRLRLMRERLGQAALLLCPSRFILDEHRKVLDLPPDRFRLSRYGFDPDRLSGHRRHVPPPLRFGFLGTLIHTKGVHVLVEAFNGVPRGEVELHVFGAAPAHVRKYEERLRRAARHPGIRFRGPVDRKQVAAALSEIDALVVPSIWHENAPLVLHEAAICKVPVIAPDLGGMGEFVRTYGNGLLYRADDPEDLRRTLLDVIRAPETLDALREPRTPIRTVDENVEELLEIYRSVCALR